MQASMRVPGPGGKGGGSGGDEGGVGGGGWRDGDECEPPPPPAAAVEGCRRLAGRALSCWGRHYAAFWAGLPEELQRYCDRVIWL